MALSRVPAIGAKLYRSLIGHFGSAVEVLRASCSDLQEVEGIAARTAAQFDSSLYRREAERILTFCEHKSVEILYLGNKRYPAALQRFDTAPAVLYHYGQTDLANLHSVAIVGTRKMTAAGALQVERLIDPLLDYGALIISGLAYGVDIAAHRRALRLGLPTLAVLGSGFEHIYPHTNRKTAWKMTEQGGGLLTEYPPWQRPEREHFPARNRIVAMLAQLTVVVESDISGGSIITANMAHDYGRKVGACPGRGGDTATAGCNKLIKSGKAHLIEEASDIVSLLGWRGTAARAVQTALFSELPPPQARIVETVRGLGQPSIDDLYRALGEPPAKLAQELLTLEMMGILSALPGHRYRMSAQ